MAASVTDLSPKLSIDDLGRAPRRALAGLDKAVSGRWWLAVVVGLAFVISLLGAFPTYDNFHPHDPSWTAIERNSKHPFDQKGLDPVKDRAYNFTFRVTVPLVGGVLGLSPAGFLVLQGLGGIALFAVSAVVVERLTASRRLAALAAISTGLMWAGASAFVEVRGNFDVIAIVLLVAAMATRRVPLIVLCTFLAAWTDERAIPIVAFVMLFHHVVESREIGWLPALKDWRVLAGAVGVVAHLVTREVAAKAFDLHQPSNLGFSYIKDQINILPVGAWTALEGFWIFVVAGAVVLWHIRQRLLALAYVGLIALFCVASIAVVDVTRSMAYLLPAAFVGIALMARFLDRRLLRHAMYGAFAATLVWPMYYAGGAFKVYLNYPLPLVILRKATGIG